MAYVHILPLKDDVKGAMLGCCCHPRVTRPLKPVRAQTEEEPGTRMQPRSTMFLLQRSPGMLPAAANSEVMWGVCCIWKQHTMQMILRATAVSTCALAGAQASIHTCTCTQGMPRVHWSTGGRCFKARKCCSARKCCVFCLLLAGPGTKHLWHLRSPCLISQ